MQPDEWRAITTLLEEGFDVVHLRKPTSTISEVEGLLRQIPRYLHCRIALHDHFSLHNDYEIGGIHLNRRSPHPPCGYEGRVTTSCHSLEEVDAVSSEVEYMFLSPIYSSISKSGYESNFSHEELLDGKKRGVINERVVALGGVTPQNIDQIKMYGFGGVALLGYIWQDLQRESLSRRTHELLKIVKDK